MTIILDFIQYNKIIISRKCHPLKQQEFEKKWDELTTLLNNEENGARKDKQQWKHVSIHITSIFF